jgi:hypothetical protein
MPIFVIVNGDAPMSVPIGSLSGQALSATCRPSRQEAQQFGVYLSRVRPRVAARTLLHNQKVRPLGEFGAD